MKDGATGSSMHGTGGNPKLKGAIPSAPSNPNFEGVSTIGTTISPIDQDVRAMLHKSQSGYFNREGDNVGKHLEEWLEKMENYYNLTKI